MDEFSGLDDGMNAGLTQQRLLTADDTTETIENRHKVTMKDRREITYGLSVGTTAIA